jgi:hypothetical protein
MKELYKGYTIEIEYDQFGSNPADDGNFKIITYNRGGYANNAKVTDVPMDSDEPTAEIADGRAFPLIYSEHGNCLYQLAGSYEPEPDGYIVLEPEYVKGIILAERRLYARGDLEEYTKWANGEVYTVSITDPYGDLVEDDGQVGDLLGYEWALEHAHYVIDNHGINLATKAKNARELHR